MAQRDKAHVAYCPIPSKGALMRRLASGQYQATPLGLEARCTVCNDYWPADTEFFHLNHSSTTGLSARCKVCDSACRAEAKAA